MGKKIEKLTMEDVWNEEDGTLNDLVIVRKLNEIIDRINEEAQDE